MAVSWGASNGKEYWDLRGLSSDEKPVKGVPNGSKFEEIDTGNEYKLDAETGTWYLQPKAAGGGGTVTAGVASFNNRQGAVMPLAGDYTADMVGADPAGSAAQALTDANAYTDAALAEAKTYTDNALVDAKAYTDAELAGFTVTTEFTQAVETVVEPIVEQTLQNSITKADIGTLDALFP